MKESDFQAKIIKWLKSKGCIALKYQQNATTQAGIADIMFFKEGFYGFIEVKKAKNAAIRPGQREFIEKINNWSWGKIVWPEIWDETKKELEELLK